jgi:hypothetical protein
MTEQAFDADEYIWGQLTALADQLVDGQPLHVQDQVRAAIRDRHLGIRIEPAEGLTRENGRMILSVDGRDLLEVALTVIDPQERVFS